MNFRNLARTAGGAMLLAAAASYAQIPQYGPNITQEQAKKVTAAAEAESHKRGWPMAIAIVDNAGHLVHYTKMDNTQTISVTVSQDKAVSAATTRRSTKVLQDQIAGGGAGMRFMALRGGMPIEGGLPLYVDGKVVGAIGVSGMASNEDGEIAAVGAAVLK